MNTSIHPDIADRGHFSDIGSAAIVVRARVLLLLVLGHKGAT